MKKGSGAIIAFIAVIAVCLVVVSTILGIKAKKAISPAPEESSGNISESEATEAPTISLTITEPSAEATTQQAITTIQEQITTAVNKVTTTVKQTVTANNGSTAKVVVENDVTVPVIEDVEKGKAPEVGTTIATSELPKDMYFSGLYNMGYDTIGLKDFIYNNDTADDCIQRNFGYNVLYDEGAKLIDFSIETTRIKFDYEGKSYMLQLWKGQYISGEVGTVGGEVGLYTRKANKVSAIGQYDCAAKEDWLNMEMTILWDENGDGIYTPQLTRKYALHWWETGYVDGQLRNRKSSNELRILNRITFKTEEQATLCVNAMIKNGFTKVSTFNPTIKDTVKQYGKDVIYVWQDVR
ncbi:MAG: DUF4474 domain-containing protein [Clostridia bacterium]|nr:DUF4474 domain-containing protein [Clostridia bacterium]